MMYKGFVAAALLAAAMVSPALAQDVDTTTGATAKLGAIGIGQNNAVGTTFTPGTQNVLDGFSFYVMDNGPAPAVPYEFKAYVYAWDGTKATGSALFESALQQYTGGVASGIEYSFDTGGLALASGGKYVLLFSNAGIQATNTTHGVSTKFAQGDVYAGGELVYSRGGDNFASMLAGPWESYSPDGADLAFKLDFADPTGVPEPAAWGMMIAGMGLAGASVRRRGRKAARA